MTDPHWPEPADDPPEERGENPEHHLLPTLEALRAMTPEQRRTLLELVADWEGQLVDRWRERVRELP